MGISFGRIIQLVFDSATSSLNVKVTGGTSTGYTEDAAAPSDPVGSAVILVRRDTLSATEVSADGDNVAQKGTSKGQAHAQTLAVLHPAVMARL